MAAAGGGPGGNGAGRTVAGTRRGRWRESPFPLLESGGLAGKRRCLRLAQAGQEYAIGVARELANEPPLIFADEPTAALDTGRG